MSLKKCFFVHVINIRTPIKPWSNNVFVTAATSLQQFQVSSGIGENNPKYTRPIKSELIETLRNNGRATVCT